MTALTNHHLTVTDQHGKQIRGKAPILCVGVANADDQWLFKGTFMRAQDGGAQDP